MHICLENPNIYTRVCVYITKKVFCFPLFVYLILGVFILLAHIRILQKHILLQVCIPYLSKPNDILVLLNGDLPWHLWACVPPGSSPCSLCKWTLKDGDKHLKGAVINISCVKWAEILCVMFSSSKVRSTRRCITRWSELPYLHVVFVCLMQPFPG